MNRKRLRAFSSLDKKGQLGPAPVIPMPGAFSQIHAAMIAGGMFLVILVLELALRPYFEFGPLALSALILFIFGFLHFFHTSILYRLLLGILPLVLAIAALPEALGGIGFGDFISKIPLINLIAPGNLAGALRYLLLALVFFGHYWFLHRVATRADYNAMGRQAGTQALRGGAYTWQNFSIGRMIAWLLLVAVIYGIENSSRFLSITFPQEYGVYFVSLVVLILGFVFLLRRGIASKLLALVSFLVGLAGLSTLLPYVDALFKNALLSPFLAGEASFFRYAFIGIILFYFMFRGHPRWGQPVTP